MPRYRTVETPYRVSGVQPELVTRFKWRADRRCKKMNELETSGMLRYEVRPEVGGKHAVVAMQNVAEPIRG